jgi:hypothetical protein
MRIMGCVKHADHQMLRSHRMMNDTLPALGKTLISMPPPELHLCRSFVNAIVSSRYCMMQPAGTVPSAVAAASGAAAAAGAQAAHAHHAGSTEHALPTWTQFATSALGGCAIYRVMAHVCGTHKAGQCISLHLLARVQHRLCAPAACEQPLLQAAVVEVQCSSSQYYVLCTARRDGCRPGAWQMLPTAALVVNSAASAWVQQHMRM